ncbi:MerR family DNA-binding transcriptional regulator [Paenibacillus chitinolyticus]|uniref:MerR family DNA-binding transcriptional regulator n=1 Tax=Paenibacillus chitinolyticus TaxID=79263 RepID=A0A410WPR2_9BACL|nr:MerR family transcriptional regulator [Paenibacillus chitinolyticus]MCY9590983.1 MerR family transcriptional regulator [Paenibacillus chitinolyticus]MCY9597216.1 MerR family transcriptional regulator [Paenibacillus chitinolyticus]QAV16416.1 MerR family DNA-binding transcriptional regulator [Paenibacillus chitinolyticus]
MLKISEFSKLSGVSVKALRFYNSLKLLEPAAIDPANGYRYYTQKQLLTVKRITAFKEHGFTLDQIKNFLEEHPIPDVKLKLVDKKKELERSILEAQQQLKEINNRITRVEEADSRQQETPITVRNVQPQLTASIRDIVPRTHLCLLLDELTRYVNSYGEDEGRDLTILWYDHDNSDTDQADLEVALPLTKAIPSSGRVNVGLMPGLEAAASLVHLCNPYDNSCLAADRLVSWISSQGYVRSYKEPIRETYLTSDKDIYGKMRLAELLIPLELG